MVDGGVPLGPGDGGQGCRGTDSGGVEVDDGGRAWLGPAVAGDHRGVRPEGGALSTLVPCGPVLLDLGLVVLPGLDQVECVGAVLVRAAVDVCGARSDERGGHQRAVELAADQLHAAELPLPVDLVVVVVLHRIEAEFEQLQMQVVRLGLGDAPVGAEQVFDQAAFEGRLGWHAGRPGRVPCLRCE